MRRNLNPARILILGFTAMIIIGAILLKLPIAVREGVTVSFMTALFTSTSATCINGLVVVDTGLTWSVFGQVVIICLVQIGGLGFMSVTTIFFFVMHKKIGLSQRIMIVQSLHLRDIQGVVGLIRHVLFGTFIFEALGAIALWYRFYPEYGFWDGLGMGVFHSISAFCNSGFDLMGEKSPFSSLTAYSADGVIIITIVLLIIIGGLGFFVWEDILRKRSFKKLHLHSKLVISITLILLLSGWIFFYLAERTNPETIGNMSLTDALLCSLLQSVTPRTCGFCVVNQDSLRGVSIMVVILFMLIGGSAGSTAGGIKNVTTGILFLSAFNSLRGKSRVSIFGGTIPSSQITSAISIFIIVITVCSVGTIAISLIQPELSIGSVIFETVSAVSTCGLSLGATPNLAPASQVVIMLLMLFGRAGIMTFGMAAFIHHRNVEKTKRPDTWVMIG